MARKTGNKIKGKKNPCNKRGYLGIGGRRAVYYLWCDGLVPPCFGKQRSQFAHVVEAGDASHIQLGAVAIFGVDKNIETARQCRLDAHDAVLDHRAFIGQEPHGTCSMEKNGRIGLPALYVVATEHSVLEPIDQAGGRQIAANLFQGTTGGNAKGNFEVLEHGVDPRYGLQFFLEGLERPPSVLRFKSWRQTSFGAVVQVAHDIVQGLSQKLPYHKFQIKGQPQIAGHGDQYLGGDRFTVDQDSVAIKNNTLVPHDMDLAHRAILSQSAV